MNFNYISFLALSYSCVTRAKIINLSASLSIQLPISILQGNVCNNALGFPLILLLKLFMRCKNQQVSLLWTYSREFKITHKNCAQILIVALFKIAKGRNNPVSINWWIYTMWPFHVMEYCLTMKRNEVLMQYGSMSKTLSYLIKG